MLPFEMTLSLALKRLVRCFPKLPGLYPDSIEPLPYKHFPSICKLFINVILDNCMLDTFFLYPFCLYMEFQAMMYDKYHFKSHVYIYEPVTYVSIYVPCMVYIGHTQNRYNFIVYSIPPGGLEYHHLTIARCPVI